MRVGAAPRRVAPGKSVQVTAFMLNYSISLPKHPDEEAKEKSESN
jgi:hypothetical protein